MKDRLKTLRKQLNLSQQEMADKLGINRGTYANYEVGRNEPIDAVTTLICKTFNVSEAWLRTGEGDMFIQIDPEDELMEWAGKVLATKPDDFRRRLVKVLASLDEDQWKVLEEKFKEIAGMDIDEKKEG